MKKLLSKFIVDIILSDKIMRHTLQKKKVRNIAWTIGPAIHEIIMDKQRDKINNITTEVKA